jgi:hypothetical protein
MNDEGLVKGFIVCQIVRSYSQFDKYTGNGVHNFYAWLEESRLPRPVLPSTLYDIEHGSFPAYSESRNADRVVYRLFWKGDSRFMDLPFSPCRGVSFIDADKVDEGIDVQSIPFIYGIIDELIPPKAVIDITIGKNTVYISQEVKKRILELCKINQRG